MERLFELFKSLINKLNATKLILIMKVQFDSNTWRKVVDPSQFAADENYECFVKIHEAITRGDIEAYLSETMFTTEAIVRKKRQGYFAKMAPKVTHKTSAIGNSVKMTFTLGPNEDDAILFDETIQILKDFFDKAVAMGFRIVRLPRLGGLVNPVVEKVLYIAPDFDTFFNKAVEVSEKIEGNDAGFYWLKEIGETYSTQWLDGLKKAPDTECKHIAKAAAEWADGESVAICVGLGCDYFCTHDQAKGAGHRSVFSANNLSWLKNDYHFTTIDIPSLAALL